MMRPQPMLVLADVEAGSKWFKTDDFDAVLARADAAGATVLDGPLVNPNARQRELWLRGPEGYTVVVAGPRTA